MTKEIHDRLTQYESILRGVVYNNYARVADSDMKALAQIYLEHFGVGLSKSQMGCSHCKMTALKRLGTDYFAYVEPKKRTRKTTVNSPVVDNQ